MIEKIPSSATPGFQDSAPKKSVTQAAKEFESLLLAQMLRSVREAGGASGWLGSGEDSASSPAMELAEEQFAAELSRQGGLGLAALVAKGLDKGDQ